jgi:CheY-like chemotaxis protein
MVAATVPGAVGGSSFNRNTVTATIMFRVTDTLSGGDTTAAATTMMVPASASVLAQAALASEWELARAGNKARKGMRPQRNLRPFFMRRRNVDVAPTRVMAAIAHGTLSRGASIAFFVGRDKLTGWDVARHAREIDAGFPVVYMTGANADDWASKGVPNNSILLSKPFAQAQLLTAVSQLLNADSQTV